MEYSIAIQLMFFVSLTLSVVSAQESLCCRQGQGLIKKKGSPAYCWEPKENLTVSTPLRCNLTHLISEKQVNFTVNDKGQLVLFKDDVYDEPLEPGSFCVGNRTTTIDTALRHAARAALLCYEEKKEKAIDENVLNYCMLVSSVFLLLTAFVYALLPELRDLQGISIINFCISLAVGLGLMAMMNLLPYTDMTACAIKGFITYFFMIAAFFWMNAIAIQILLSIRRPTVVDYKRSSRAVAAYAWGAPAALTLASAAANYAPGVAATLRPGIGYSHCWFTGSKQQWLYMYSVMSALIAINICIFVYASLLLWRHRFSSSHIKALKYKFAMTFRLFVIMGLPWVFEMLSSLMDAHIIWAVMDVFNTLQGPLVFLLLVVLRRRCVRAARAHGWPCCAAPCADRYLAAADEEGVAHHTIVVSMDDRTIA